MPTKLESLSKAQQEQLVEWAIQMGLIKPEERDEKPKVVIDKYQLQRLFWNTKFKEPKQFKKMPHVVVRCERAKKVWHAVVKGQGVKKTHAKKQLVLTNVKFVSKTGLETEEKRQYVGCGVYNDVTLEVYSGFAEGEVVLTKTLTVPENARKLRYDREEGAFYDQCSGRKVVAAAYLILMENCHHAYIPMPKQEKG
jgi:hypothetical protein